MSRTSFYLSAFSKAWKDIYSFSAPVRMKKTFFISDTGSKTLFCSLRERTNALNQPLCSEKTTRPQARSRARPCASSPCQGLRMFFQVTPKASPSERRAGSGSYGTPGAFAYFWHPKVGRGCRVAPHPAYEFKSAAFAKATERSGDTPLIFTENRKTPSKKCEFFKKVFVYSSDLVPKEKISFVCLPQAHRRRLG